MEIMKILSWTQTSNWGNYFKTNSPEIFVMYLFFISSFSTKMPCDASLLNESKSIESLKKNEHQTEFNESTLIKYKSEAVTGWECNCWNTTSEFKLELECRCAGESLLRIPQKLFPSMQRLTIASAGLTMIRSAGFKIYSSSLRDLVLSDLHHFEYIQERAFEPLNLLRTIYISYAPKLTYISKDIFKGLSDTIKTIKIVHSGLVRIPDMRYLPLNAILQIIDLGSNKIESIYSYSIKIKTEQLILDNNMLTNIEDSAFFGSQIAKLSIAGNRLLERVNPTAFNGIMNIQELDLSNTSLSVLPSYGLGDLEILRVQNTHTLKTIPSIYYFQNLQVAWLTHSFHCCAFQFPSRHDPLRHTQNLLDMEKRQKTCATKFQQQLKQRPSDFEKQKNRDYFFKETNILNGTVSLITSIDYVPNQHEIQEIDDEDVTEVDFGEFHETADISPGLQQDAFCGNLSIKKSDVSCFPVPDALNPCEDVMGSDWLRISVWIVVSLAVIGNVAVLVVILFTRSDNHSVQKLLICHLAFADLCLGLYLFLIAFMDSHSMGEYFNYAYDWQYGAGCKVAGFLTVFASHLSVYALTIITIERWLAITYALYLNKRITVRAATYIMMVGWVYSILMSSFPLFGISNYSSTSICLPMETRNSSDVIYLVSIIGVNGVAFFIIAICYAQIYFSLGHETRHLRSLTEMSVAKKMALLVCTNFSCWVPIAFFGLTALAGYPLIDVTKSKILLVFFYPMNSCADPYLYAILTSQYRKDLYTFLSRFGLCKATAFRHRKHFTSHVTNGSYQITPFQGHNSFISSRTTQGFEMMIQADEFV